MSATLTREALDALLDSMDVDPEDEIQFLAASPSYGKSCPEAKAVLVVPDIGGGFTSVFVAKV